MSSTHKAKTLQGHTRPIKHIKFSKDGIYVFSASADRTIIKWDYINNKKSFIYNHQASVNVICISNSNKYMFSGDSTGCIYVWDINTNELKKKISFDVLYNIPSLNISSDEFYIIVTLAERSAKRTSFVGIYLTKDIISNNLPPPPNPGNIQLTPLNTFSIENSPAPNLYKKIECPEINTKFSKSCFANMNKSVLISREDGYLSIYDFNTNKLISSNKFHNDEILDFDVNDEYAIIITSSKDGVMCLINLNSFQLINIFKPINPVRNLNSCQIAIIDNPYYIAPGMMKGISVDTLFDLNTLDLTKLKYIENEEDNEKAKKYNNKKQIVLAIVGGGQDSKFVTTTEKKEGGFEIIIYNTFTGEKLAEFLEHFGPINTLAVHKNMLASGAEDATVKIYEIENYLFS
jgi:WD40 repeat protein